MNDEKDLDLLEEEIDEEVAEEPVNEAEETALDNDGGEDDFEYDENGDIILPDDKEATEEEAEEPAVETEEPAKEPSEEAEKKPAEDEEKAALRRELEALRRQTRDTLKKMGVEAESELDGLVRLAAEAEGVSEEEYRKTRDEQQEIEAARRQLRLAAFEKKKAADLAAVQSAYADTKKYGSVDEFPNSKRFKELMDSGKLTPAEAYAASHPDALQNAPKTEKNPLAGTKSHIKSSVPKGAAREKIAMPRAALAEWRELFPGKSDKELVELYKKTFDK